MIKRIKIKPLSSEAFYKSISSLLESIDDEELGKSVSLSSLETVSASSIDDTSGFNSNVKKRNKNTIDRKTNENKALLLKVLYDINPQNVLQIFSKNI